MKKIVLVILLISAVFLEADFPEKPVNIIVYTSSGGLIDITARKFVEIAAKYTDATLYIENVTGAGGLVAINRLLQEKADGYTVLACTKSNISKLAAAGSRTRLDSLYWSNLLISDPECVIMNSKLEVNNWEDMLADALVKNGRQIWVGPSAGGLDHVMAMKVWKEYGILAKWIPYKSGGKAVASLLGGQGVAYVGNPRDTFGKPQLKIAAVSSANRLQQFPDVPTFRELGSENLDDEIMWRGFAFKKGTDTAALNWFNNLCRQVTADEEWQKHWKKGGVEIVNYENEKFTEIVNKDYEEFTYYLQKIGVLESGDSNEANFLVTSANLIILLISILILLTGLFLSIRYKAAALSIWLCLIFIYIALVFLVQSFSFISNEDVGPEIVPRLWIILIIPLSFYVLLREIKAVSSEKLRQKNTHGVLWFILLLAAYVPGIIYLGYFTATFLFTPAAMLLLGYRKYSVIFMVSAGWIIFSIFIFSYLLHLNLPEELILRVVEWK